MKVIKLRRQDLKDMEDGASIEFSSLGIKLIAEPLETEIPRYPYPLNTLCAVCERRICYCPERQPDGSWEPSHPKIEELKDVFDEYSNKTIVDKINELVRAVNTLQEK